jgi:hypothetical protein
MELLLKSKDVIREFKSKVDNLDSDLFNHVVINNYEINSDCVSIVMTSSNRSKQTYFTLQSMLKSKCKNIHIILVDDSDVDQININILKNFPYYIDFISIKRQNKNWLNAVVNYNIGFKFIKGSKVVIQNAEVCHVGDPLNFIHSSMNEKSYYVFDVNASANYETNEEIYKSDITTITIYNNPFFSTWYQHTRYRNANYHFFTALLKSSFDEIKEFSYDYALGHGYDDNDFIVKILSKQINIINMKHDEIFCGGIHLFHKLYDYSAVCVNSNEEIFKHKLLNFTNLNEYKDIYEN